MSISRRIFLRSATMVAISAAAHSKLTSVAFGQRSGGGRQSAVTGFRVPDESLSDPLTYFTQSTFSAHLNSKFRLRQGTSGGAVVTLVEVKDLAPSAHKVRAHVGSRECFSLVFSGGKQLPQDTYTIEHGALGTFKLLLVPTGKQSGVAYLEAIVNRLYS